MNRFTPAQMAMLARVNALQLAGDTGTAAALLRIFFPSHVTQLASQSK